VTRQEQRTHYCSSCAKQSCGDNNCV